MPPYARTTRPIAAGDRLLFYTGGITETRNPDGDEYGEDRLAEAALAVRTSGADAIKEAVLADVNAFNEGKYEDDATLIVVGVS